MANYQMEHVKVQLRKSGAHTMEFVPYMSDAQYLKKILTEDVILNKEGGSIKINFQQNHVQTDVKIEPTTLDPAQGYTE